jgi:pimeloyl-ACP methyl ester carboxylesterase
MLMSPGTWPDRAVIVVHGIGEQAQGDTLDAFVRGLERCGCADPELIQEAQPFGSPLPQDGVRLTRDGVTADVYEVYWAPLTARKTTARSVLWWLYRSTFVPGSKLRRPSKKTWWDIATALLATVLIVSVMLFALSSLGTLSSQVACRTDPSVTCELPQEQRNVTGPEVTWGGFAQVGSVFGAISESLVISNRPLEISPSHVAGVLTRVPFRYWLIMIAIAFLVAQSLFRLTQLVSGLVQGKSPDVPGRVGIQLVMLAVFLFGLFFLIQLIAPIMVAFVLVLVAVTVVAGGARRFLAESLGDVQVYAERDENSDHYAAREAVLLQAEKAFGLVADRGYEHIVVLGHSLGSVIAFTTLDRLCRRIPDLLPRIEAFVTFGSALEKVRYFFERRKEVDERSSRWLIEPARKIAHDKPWLNLWYANDVVANPITTFQPEGTQIKSYRHKEAPDLVQLLQESTTNMVVNIDYGYPVARFPLVWTHSRYWSDMAVLSLITDICLPRPSTPAMTEDGGRAVAQIPQS